MNPLHSRLILAALLLLICSSLALGQSQPINNASQRRVSVSLRDADPVTGNLVRANSNVLMIESGGIVRSIPLDDVTMIVFAPARSDMTAGSRVPHLWLRQRGARCYDA